MIKLRFLNCVRLITCFRKDLSELEKQEAAASAMEQKMAECKAMESLHAEAFVEQLDKDQLYEAMFEEDPSGRALLLMGEEAAEIFNRSAHLMSYGS